MGGLPGACHREREPAAEETERGDELKLQLGMASESVSVAVRLPHRGCALRSAIGIGRRRHGRRTSPSRACEPHCVYAVRSTMGWGRHWHGSCYHGAVEGIDRLDLGSSASLFGGGSCDTCTRIVGLRVFFFLFHPKTCFEPILMFFLEMLLYPV